MPTGTPDITYPPDFVLPVINPRPAKRLPYFKEHPTPGPGRKKGSHNKVPYDLKRELVEAAAEVGFDGEGEQGLRGYLKHLAIRYPKCFANLLGKVLPINFTPDPAPCATINVIGIEPGRFLSKEEMQDLQQVEARTIDHVPVHSPGQENAMQPQTLEPAPEPSPRLTALEAKLLAMGHDELLELAEALNVGR